MSILKVITEPNPALRLSSKEVLLEEINDELRKKLSDMAETMYAAGGVGLAAPQVSDFRRFLVADLGYAKTVGSNKVSGKYGKSLIKMINPVILNKENEISISEGCLSVPNFSHSVKRSKLITVEFLNEFGEKTQETFKDFLAVIIQHEIDHLDGITLLTRASDLKRRRYLKKINNEKD